MNNLAILKQTAQTMSSREIAQLCQKPHDNVLKLIRSLIDGGIVKSTTPHQYMHPQNFLSRLCGGELKRKSSTSTAIGKTAINYLPKPRLSLKTLPALHGQLIKKAIACNRTKSVWKWRLKKVGTKKTVANGKLCQTKCCVIVQLPFLVAFMRQRF